MIDCPSFAAVLGVLVGVLSHQPPEGARPRVHSAVWQQACPDKPLRIKLGAHRGVCDRGSGHHRRAREAEVAECVAAAVDHELQGPAFETDVSART